MPNALRIFFPAALLSLLSCREPLYLALAIVLFYLVDPRSVPRLNRKVLTSIFLFNLAVSLSYLLMSLLREDTNLQYLLYINLKVYSITYFVTLFFSKVDMVQFFAFSRDLSFLLTITLSQILSYRKSFQDLQAAFRSRVVKQLRERKRDFVLKVFEFFFHKAMQDSQERVLAMKARGFFD